MKRYRQPKGIAYQTGHARFLDDLIDAIINLNRGTRLSMVKALFRSFDKELPTIARRIAIDLLAACDAHDLIKNVQPDSNAIAEAQRGWLEAKREP